MEYEIYKNIRTKDEFFDTWDSEQYDNLTESLKGTIYNKYKIKCKVFQRDGFICRNLECNTPESLLTMHHVKWQKDGGTDKVVNGLTLCKSCHKGYHRAKKRIVLVGRVLKLKKPNMIDWKKIKSQMRKLRKSLKSERVFLSLKEIAILMKFLEISFDGDDD